MVEQDGLPEVPNGEFPPAALPLFSGDKFMPIVTIGPIGRLASEPRNGCGTAASTSPYEHSRICSNLSKWATRTDSGCNSS